LAVSGLLSDAVERSLDIFIGSAADKPVLQLIHLLAFLFYVNTSPSSTPTLEEFLVGCEAKEDPQDPDILRVLDILRPAISNDANISLLGEVYENLIIHPKEQGSFYTPRFITRHIVEKTLAPVVESLSISELKRLKIIDPAMGAGAFILEAIEYLSEVIKKTDSNQDTVLTACGCIHGADIDPLAVETARLSVWVASGCRFKYSELRNNLRCSDSLLEDWSGQFDAIIGNPPYLFGERVPESIQENRPLFQFAKGQFDVYWLFYELVMRKYLVDGGCHGFIVPDAILARDETACIREPISKKWQILNLVQTGPVFGGASVSGAIVVWRKSALDGHPVSIETGRFDGMDYIPLGKLSQHALADLPGCRWLIGVDSESIEQLDWLFTNSRPLGTLAKISRGEELGKAALSSQSGVDMVGVLAGDDVVSLGCSKPSRYVARKSVRKKPIKYTSPKIVLVKTGKTLVASVDLEDTVTLQSIYNIHVTGCDIWYVCGLLASELINKVIGSICTDHKQIFPQLNQSTVASIPIFIPEPSDIQSLQMVAAISAAAEEAYTASPERRVILRQQIDELLAKGIMHFI
jgi:hypothetical protein